MILDFSKAFDTVPTEELLCKLDSYGIKAPIRTWLRTFLTKRHMRVVVVGKQPVKFELSQGYPRTQYWAPPLPVSHH